MADPQLRSRPGKAKAKASRLESVDDNSVQKTHKVQSQHVVSSILMNSIRVHMLLKRMRKGKGGGLRWLSLLRLHFSLVFIN